MNKLHTSPCYNPYLIGNGQVNNIHFYDDSGVIATTNRGWIGNNRIDILELNDLEFNKRNKLNLDRKEHFFIKSEKQDSYNSTVQLEVYIYIPKSALSIKPLGELVAMEADTDTYYGRFYELTATFNDCYDFSKDKHETRKFMEGTYTKTEKTEKGKLVDKIKKLTDLDLSASRKLLENKSELIKLLNGG